MHHGESGSRLMLVLVSGLLLLLRRKKHCKPICRLDGSLLFFRAGDAIGSICAAGRSV